MARTQGSHSDITGPRIRQAAQSLFAKHGFAAVSMRRIASQVGLQVGALYNYTPDKQSLLFDLMREHMLDLLAACGDLGGGDDAAARLEVFTRFHIRFHLERPDAVFIAYMELRNLTPANFAEISTLRDRYEAGLEDILKQGVAQGRFSVPDTRIAAMAVIAMLTGVNTWYRRGGRLSLDAVEAVYWQMVKQSVGMMADRPAPG